MDVSDFDYELPEGAIARHPTSARDGARLLVVDRAAQSLAHETFASLPALLRPSDLVIVNDSRVIRARLRAKKLDTGGSVEVLLVERTSDRFTWKAMLGTNKKPKVGLRMVFETEGTAEVLSAIGEGFFLLRFSADPLELANEIGELPLPPYLNRRPEPEDDDRYQTIFSREEALGSVAAPTAGLHFSSEVFQALAKRDIQRAQLTLHVGPGTFLPIRTERIDDHVMHEERYELDAAAASAIARARAVGGRLVAVGTTVTRVLESVEFPHVATSGSTDIFIKPGFVFRHVDVLLTNFHLPRSTLLMLVAAFGGYDLIMRAYREAVERGYRFYSYGDAMLIR